MKKVCLLDNPISGSTVHTARVEALLARLKDHGFNVTCETLASFEQTRNVIEDQLKAGCDIFIVSGGDGTVRSVAQHLTDTRIPLLIFLPAMRICWPASLDSAPNLPMRWI